MRDEESKGSRGLERDIGREERERMRMRKRMRESGSERMRQRGESHGRERVRGMGERASARGYSSGPAEDWRVDCVSSLEVSNLHDGGEREREREERGGSGRSLNQYPPDAIPRRSRTHKRGTGT